MRKGAAKRTPVPGVFRNEAFPIVPPTDRPMHTEGPEMDAKRPETSTFVHFIAKAQMRLYPLVLLEEAVIGLAYRGRGRDGQLSAFALYLRQSGGSR